MRLYATQRFPLLLITPLIQPHRARTPQYCADGFGLPASAICSRMTLPPKCRNRAACKMALAELESDGTERVQVAREGRRIRDAVPAAPRRRHRAGGALSTWMPPPGSPAEDRVRPGADGGSRAPANASKACRRARRSTHPHSRRRTKRALRPTKARLRRVELCGRRVATGAGQRAQEPRIQGPRRALPTRTGRCRRASTSTVAAWSSVMARLGHVVLLRLPRHDLARARRLRRRRRRAKVPRL